MNGYGGQGMSQITTPEQLAQALQAHNVLSNRQETQQRFNSSGNPYAVLGAALGGILSQKFGKYKGQNLGSIEQQLEQYNAEAQAKIESVKEAKRKREEDEKWKRQREAKKEDMAAGFENQKALAAHNASLRPQDQPSFQERMYNSLSPEQRQAFNNKFAGIQQQGGGFSPEIQAGLQSGAISKEEAIKLQRDKSMGVKPQKELSPDMKFKMSNISNARRALEDYKSKAFDESGDYKEFGTMFGNTNSLLEEAIASKLRAESGATITPQEVKSQMDIYAPSRIRGDATNMAKIKQLEEALANIEQTVGGQPAQQDSQLTPQDMQQTQNLLNKYLK